MTPVNKALARDALRAIRNRKAEFTESGLFVPGANMVAFGHFSARYAAPGEYFGPATIGANRVVKEGLIEALNLIAGHISSTAKYLAPFTGDVAVSPDWKGSTFPALATEFTAYTSNTRVPWTTVQATTNAQVSNAAALAAATITFNTGGPYTIRGIGLLAAQGKGSTTGPLFAASRFADDLAGMTGGGKLALQYDLSAVDEGDI